jgi:predicted nucleic acid-binding protein
MTDKIFLDTNLWIYLYAKDPPEKSHKVEDIIKNNLHSLAISTQVLGELFVSAQ